MHDHTFLLIRPFFVKPLTIEEQEVLLRHGCSLCAYPNDRFPFGHLVAAPNGTRMHMVSTKFSSLLFPDGFQAALIWTKGSYSFDELEQASAKWRELRDDEAVQKAKNFLDTSPH